MEVDPTEPGDAEQVGREDLAIGRRDQQVGAERAELLEGLGGVDVLGLIDGDAPRQRCLLDRRWGSAPAFAPAGGRAG